MRWLLVLLITATPALAKEPDLSRGCPQERTWTKLQSCLETRGDMFIVHKLPEAKLVGYALSPDTTRLELYVLTDGTWRSTSSWTTTRGAELINFGTYGGDAYRVDVGTAFESRIMLLPHSSQPAVVKRITTSICPRRGFCRSIVTSCDVLVRGRSYWWFRGKPVWKKDKLMVIGDVSNAGTHCRVSRFQLTTEDAS